MNANFKMWAFWITHMVAYLCAILCLVMGIQGNIQKQWGACEFEALCTQKLRSFKNLFFGEQRTTKRPHTRNNSINTSQTLNTIKNQVSPLKIFPPQFI
jgi:hypothetical protein